MIGVSATKAKDEARSLVNLSRENLTMCQPNGETFWSGRTRSRLNWNGLSCATALLLACLCLALEIWQLSSSIGNAREIGKLRRDVESLKHRMLADDTVNALRALELRVEATEDEDGSAMDDFDYKSYDEDEDEEENEEQEDEEEGQEGEEEREDDPSGLIYGSKPSDFPRFAETSSATTSADHHVNVNATDFNRQVLRLLEEFESRRRLDDKRRADDEERRRRRRRRHQSQTETADDASRTMRKRATRDGTALDLVAEESTVSPSVPDKHPPKKYHSRNLTEHGRTLASKPGKTIVVATHEVYAAHYGADYTIMRAEDEHTGNGRARHNEGVFKAWTASDWVGDLGMTRYFDLATGDGRLTVHEPGLYLVYAQIHYLDEHDENGFHLLVNGAPVMQCMLYSPGVGHKSRSCFTAQLVFLHSGDRLVLKDVGPARYTLFQKDKSFFGLAKIGEPRQQQRHAPQPTP